MTETPCPECGWGDPTVAWSEACEACAQAERDAYTEWLIDRDREA